MNYFIFCMIILVLLHLLLWHYFPNVPKRKVNISYDTCIVLGCPSRDDGSISRMQKSRMDKAISLYHEKVVKTILVSGAGVRNDYIEADVMGDYALSQNVLQKDILKEEKAQNTYDNLRYAKEICDERHFQNVLVVTSGFHMRRSNYFVRRFFANYAFDAPADKEKVKHYIAEYFRMWNTLYFEIKLAYKKKN